MTALSPLSVVLSLSLLVIGGPVAVWAQPAATTTPAEGQTPNVPSVTDADRQAAFPDVEGHRSHDNAVHSLVLFDRLEWTTTGGAQGATWDNRTWVGRDRDRLWVRSEGQVDGGRVGEADAHLLYGRAFSRWWDVVVGARQDVRPGAAQTWAAIGLQGLAPYWFDVEMTGYVGAGGRTAARIEAEYELRLTNRLIAQPRMELNLYGKSDPARGIGAGLSTAEPGVRVRYEFRRELAPYLGVAWHRRYGGTADFAKRAEEEARVLRLVAGVRWWF